VTARLATEQETLDAIREGARLEDSDRMLNGFDSLDALDRSLRDVDALDVALWAGDDLETLMEYRHARVEAAYAEAQVEEMERWIQ